MNTFLSDAGIGYASSVLWILLLILLVVILTEASVMALFKIGNFGKAFLNSSLVNIVSAIAGFVVINQLGAVSEKISPLEQWLIFYGISILIEGLMMMLLMKQVSKGKLWIVTVIMNLASYIFLYLITIL